MNVVSARAGSSPHTRGARSRSGIGMRARRDHPRIRGEHPKNGRNREMPLGSSPHTRGAPRSAGSGKPDARIIPAYAGSTRNIAIGSVSSRDHPRIRGEHETSVADVDPESGSSPHTRGALRLGAILRQKRRIIPAYAGSTSGQLALDEWTEDHPRIRGEHAAASTTRTSRTGSSPHTRGALGDAGGGRRR